MSQDTSHLNIGGGGGGGEGGICISPEPFHTKQK